MALQNGANGNTAIALDEMKKSHVRLSDIVTNEQLSLTAASKLGISIPESFIINTGAARDDEILFATKRYDRVIPSA